MPVFEKRRVLIVVRTYPTPAAKGVEVSCTAGITDDGKWIRMFPVPYRFLSQDQRFRKYQWVDVEVAKASDTRPESYKLRPDSITIVSEQLSSQNDWAERKRIIYPLRSRSICALQRERDEKLYPTLGFFRPKSIERLILSPESPTWTEAQLQILRQKHLFEQGPENELEKIPYSFKYQFTCDEADCTGHTMSCTDWEMGESWRSWKDKYQEDLEAKFRLRYEHEMIRSKDTHFFVGTVHKHPNAWIIVGLFYPPRPDHPVLFD